jgi:uncharacterized protein (TIGR02996 family)
MRLRLVDRRSGSVEEFALPALVVMGRAQALTGVTLTVADGRVSHRHLRFEATSRGVQVTDLGGTNGAFIGTARLQSAFLEPGASVTFVDYELSVLDDDRRVPSPAEAVALERLLADPLDGPTREVYADVLEAEGEVARAEFLRKELKGEVIALEAMQAMPGPWRERVSLAPVVNCPRKCGQRWCSLPAGEEPLRRACQQCQQPVHLVRDRSDVWALSNLEVLLAIEPGVPWQPVDLVPVRPRRPRR